MFLTSHLFFHCSHSNCFKYEVSAKLEPGWSFKSVFTVVIIAIGAISGVKLSLIIPPPPPRCWPDFDKRHQGRFKITTNLLKDGLWQISMGIIPRKPCVKSDQIKFSKEVEGDINFGLPFKVNSITLWPGEVSGFRQSAHFTRWPLYIIYPGFFNFDSHFIAHPLSCKTYHQHIESSSNFGFFDDLQGILRRCVEG